MIQLFQANWPEQFDLGDSPWPDTFCALSTLGMDEVGGTLCMGWFWTWCLWANRKYHGIVPSITLRIVLWWDTSDADIWVGGERLGRGLQCQLVGNNHLTYLNHLLPTLPIWLEDLSPNFFSDVFHSNHNANTLLETLLKNATRKKGQPTSYVSDHLHHLSVQTRK
jgi:hypothetical protein